MPWRIARNAGYDRRAAWSFAKRVSNMKHGRAERATTMELEHAAGYDRVIVETGASPWGGGQGVSEAIGRRFVTGFDSIAIFGAGIAAMHWDPSPINWRLKGLVVLLGAVLGVNFLRLTGAHRFDQLGDLGAAAGRALLGWLLTLGALFLATFLIEPLTVTNGTWAAVWFSGGVVLLVTSRVVLQRQMRLWSRTGRLGEVVAVVGAGPSSQRLLRSLNAAPGGPRIFGVYDDDAARLPQRCMGHSILGSVHELVRDARVHGIDTVIIALPSTIDHLLLESLNKLSLV